MKNFLIGMGDILIPLAAALLTLLVLSVSTKAVSDVTASVLVALIVAAVWTLCTNDWPSQ